MYLGYHPDQYPTSLEWDARLMMEISMAIKSPNINYHLAGTKKVQQELARPGNLEKFLGDKAQIKSVRDIFTGLYPLDNVSSLFTINTQRTDQHYCTSKKFSRFL